MWMKHSTITSQGIAIPAIPVYNKMNGYRILPRKGYELMKKSVLKESLRLYGKNFPSLLLALLVELVLRAIALTPLLFLAEKNLAPLALLAIPLYLLIVLPARQNYALALQDMLSGGSVFSLRLVETRDYGRKLWRGLKSCFCLLLWSSLTIAGLGLLYAALTDMMDFVTLMKVFRSVGSIFSKSGDLIVTGIVAVVATIAATALLIVLGCAVHSGTRHAHALGNQKLLKGRRLRLIGLWFAGLLLMAPYAAVVVSTLGGYMGTIMAAIKKLEFPSLALTMQQTLLLAGGAAVLLLPLLPLKNLLPAVFLRLEKEKSDAAA